MTRRPAAPPRPGVPIRPDTPAEGYFLMPLVRGGPLCTVRIWRGPGVDPATGEETDRSPRWMCEIDGCITNRQGEPWSEDDVLDTYLWAAKRPTTEADYRYRRALADHAKAHEPDMAEAEPNRKVDHMKGLPW